MFAVKAWVDSRGTGLRNPHFAQAWHRVLVLKRTAPSADFACSKLPDALELVSNRLATSSKNRRIGVLTSSLPLVHCSEIKSPIITCVPSSQSVSVDCLERQKVVGC
jgi:hypothetical protein